MSQDPKNKKEKKKKLEDLLRHSSFIFLFLLFAFLIVSYGSEELSFMRITGLVSFNGGEPAMGSVYTTDDLNCSWSQDDTINITLVWLNGTDPVITLRGNTTNLISPQILDSSYTQKDETWFCRVTLFNSTDNVTNEVNITVDNSPPINLKVYYVGEVDSTFTIYEDIEYNLIINATDADNDTLIYSIEDETNSLDICSVEPYTGYINCSVDHDTLLSAGNETTKYQYDTQFQATDNDEGGLPNKLIDFTLIPVNDEPVITLVGYEPDIDVDDTDYTQAFTVTDEENNSYILSVVNNDLDAPGSLSYVEVNNVTNEIYFNTTDGSAAIADFGNYSINITAVDASDSSVNTTLVYNLTIESTNHDPNITQIIQYITGVQGQPFVLQFHATDADIGVGENLSFNASKTSFDVFSNFVNYTINDVGHYNATINITALSNTNIVERNFTVTVTDQFSAWDSTVINAELNNTNDYPIISDNSTNENNTFVWSQNISNVSAYFYTHFIYVINGSDIDNLTYEGENITYTMNYSGDYFNLSSDGVFTFYTTNTSLINNTYYFNITLTDDGTSNSQAGTPLSTSEVLVLNVLNNSLPYFIYGLDNVNCSEDIECSFNVTGTDDDPGDSVNYSVESITIINNSGNSSFTFNISQSDGVINFTPEQLVVGNYLINLSLADQRGAVIYDSFNLSINNTNDAPTFVSLPIVFPDRSAEGIFYQIPFSSTTLADADDEDLYLVNPTEVLNYSFNITPTTPDVFSINPSTGDITIDTSVADCANKTYNVTIIVTDSAGADNTADTNFTIYLRNDPPEIQEIYPYGDENDSYNVVYDWYTTNQTSGGTTTFVESENTTIIFNHTTNDSDSTMSYNWSIDGIPITDSSLIESNHTLNYTFDFFSNGSYEIFLEISDDTFNNANWTWDVNITNVNRPPILNNSLANFTGNRSIDGSIMVPDYFTISSFSSGLQRFYDPDFDTNGDWLLGDNETSGLSYVYTSGCNSYITFTISGDDITLKGLAEGECSVTFTAEDSFGEVVASNEVFINVSAEYEEPNTPQGGTTNNPTILPLNDDDDPVPLEIISAKSVVMYQNQTIIIPIELKNNWTGALDDISLYVTTDEEDVEYVLSQDFFDFIPVGDSEMVNLTLRNYREPGSYELNVHANVTDPDFSDSALIIINSLEEKHEGETLETKLSFARDLLDNNGECQELVELLRKAEDSLAEGNQEATSKFLDVAINGCKHMIAEYNKETINREPGRISLVLGRDFLKDLLNNRTKLMIIGVIILVLVVALIFVRKWMLKKKKPEFTDIEQEHKEISKEEYK